MIFQLDDELWFPDPHLADEDGCLAVGGDLSVDRLLLAYQYGIFPWYAFRYDKPVWYCPKKRFVIFPDEIHVSHSMRTLMNKHRYRVSFNEDFEGVIRNCGRLRINEDMAWLGPEMTAAYIELHRQGFAASVEVWSSESSELSENSEKSEKSELSELSEPSESSEPSEHLVGGLYGVNIGNAFFGESMFSLVPSGSKLALIALARMMQSCGGSLIDCQLETPHLKSMGGRYIDYDEYMKIISSAD